MAYIFFGALFGILIGLFIRQGKFLGQLKKEHDALRLRIDEFDRREVHGNSVPTQQNKNCVGVEVTSYEDILDVDFSPVLDSFFDDDMDIE